MGKTLTELLHDSSSVFDGKSVQQVVAFAGKLTEGSDASKQFRDLLDIIPSSSLEEYAEHCLVGFEGSG